LSQESICDTRALLQDAIDKGKRILFEGAQGTMLDIDFGTYPFVTSSTTTPGDRVRIENGKMIIGANTIVNGNYTIVDEIQKELGITAMVFQRDGDDFRRISTNVMKKDGTRAIGTYPGKDSAAYEPLVNGKTYIGEAKFLGIPYLTSYSPIFNSSNKIMGVLYVGVSTKVYSTLLNSSFINEFLITRNPR